MRVLDLFSCVGCHALGMSRAGHETIAFCENNPWRRHILFNQFPGIPVYDDIQDAAFKGRNADICFGGPPCQKTSVASAISGNRTGSTLWPYMLKAGLDAGCKWFVVEQPPGNATWEAEVSGDLSYFGYHVGRFEFGACDIGAPYLRRRVFMVACTSLPRLEIAWSSIPQAIKRAKRSAHARGDWNPNTVPSFGMDTWRSEDVDERFERIEALGDSNPPAMAEVIGHMLSAGIGRAP